MMLTSLPTIKRSRKNLKNILTMPEMSISMIHDILNEAENFSQNAFWQPKRQMFVANAFLEPSTRTRMSFEVAEKKLGLEVLNVDSASSSIQKGESLYDTDKRLESIGADVLVIRHSQDRYFDELTEKINIPIINGGDGCGHHPTQSLLDLLTIKQEFSQFQGLKVVIVGDIRHSRVARSNFDVLQRLGAEVYVSGPKKWVEEDMLPYYLPMTEAVKKADVMMMLRIQHERHESQADINDYHEQFGLTVDREREMKPGAIIMHPAPVNRGVEIASELVECDRSRIFKQMHNGVAVRMAVLKYVLDHSC